MTTKTQAIAQYPDEIIPMETLIEIAENERKSWLIGRETLAIRYRVHARNNNKQGMDECTKGMEECENALAEIRKILAEYRKAGDKATE